MSRIWVPVLLFIGVCFQTALTLTVGIVIYTWFVRNNREQELYPYTKGIFLVLVIITVFSVAGLLLIGIPPFANMVKLWYTVGTLIGMWWITSRLLTKKRNQGK